MTDPIRPTDEEAREIAASLLNETRHAALATLTDEGHPMVTRVAFGRAETGTPLTLISSLSQHTKMLQTTPRCSLLIGEPGPKGDPLTHPRLTLQATAQFVAHSDPVYNEMAQHYLLSHPKAKLYIGFADFCFALFQVQIGYLNGGFGKAYHLTPQDMGLTR